MAGRRPHYNPELTIRRAAFRDFFGASEVLKSRTDFNGLPRSVKSRFGPGKCPAAAGSQRCLGTRI
jgi:hypothetical protein